MVMGPVRSKCMSRDDIRSITHPPRRPRHQKWQLEVDVDGADRACSKLREMMHAEAKASLKAWRTTQTALKREQRRNKLSTQNKNATATLIHKSVRKHSTKPLSRRNERRITALNDELRAQRKRLATLHRHMTHTEPHKAPSSRPA